MKRLTILASCAILSLLSLTILTLTGCGSGSGDAAQVAAVTTGAQKVSTPGAEEKFVPDELLIQFYAGVSKDISDEVLRGQGVSEADEIQSIRVKRIKVPEQALEQVMAALAKNKHVKFVEKNYIADPVAIPNDPSFPVQWHLSKIFAPQGWDVSTGQSLVKIGIADSGVDPAHPDLASKLLPGYNFYDNNTDTQDVYGHGTQVAGSAAAIGNNGVGISGVAWNNGIVPLRVTDTSGYAYSSTMANAVTYCADHGIRVVNLSFAGTSSSATVQTAIDYAWKKGTIVFAAAGNSASSVTNYPAGYNNVVAVSATTSTDTRASFSNYGSWITVAAPGSGIYTTSRGGGYASVSGTSFASPITAAVGALVLSVNQSLTAQQVVDIIKQSADDLGTSGFDQDFGYGRVNVAKALAAAQVAVVQTDGTPPTITVSTPTGVVSGNVTIASSATDNIGVTKVDLLVGGNMVASDTTEPFTFLFDSTTVPDGSYQVQARAYDAAGNTATSAAAIITVKNVADATPPSVWFTAPSQTSISKINKVTIGASASDDVGVSRMDLYIDGAWKVSASSGNISWVWSTVKVATGTHVIKVTAVDTAGNMSSAQMYLVK